MTQITEMMRLTKKMPQKCVLAGTDVLRQIENYGTLVETVDGNVDFIPGTVFFIPNAEMEGGGLALGF